MVHPCWLVGQLNEPSPVLIGQADDSINPSSGRNCGYKPGVNKLFFCKGPVSQYFRLCRTLDQLLDLNGWAMAASKSNFIYKMGARPDLAPTFCINLLKSSYGNTVDTRSQRMRLVFLPPSSCKKVSKFCEDRRMFTFNLVSTACQVPSVH